MVIYFTTNVISPPMTIFMGNDKYENEDLIKWGWPEDVWFHVDKVSSAHVYLRLQKNQTLDDIPTSVLEDCAQLVKANSIQGNFINDFDIHIYTYYLKKTAGMEVGQVGFHNQKEVRVIQVAKRINETINRLNKTRSEVEHVDLRAQREERDRKERENEKKIARELKEKEKKEQKMKQELAEQRSYSALMKPEYMKSNKESDNDSDEFM
ncbi:coiled-coil domain-containing protein 25-like [Centruroides sculpturatus]|uniref:coiled-coil domain-containing protein 25-like n=1 Tax=Centruroides sculpturatus TaxID=218467 RepID=UPI000C6D2D2B|nr:coiled-coil domain-containing protein 25-like [Centruroides sculpturatus]